MNVPGKRGRSVLADAEKQLKSFIDKFEPKNQALIRAIRKALRKRLPTANELAGLSDSDSFLFDKLLSF
jgi:hypothetical protein